jgi:hypothetical protein
VPKRLDFEWTIDDGLVNIKVQKFNGKLGKSFVKLIRKENFFIQQLNKIGSSVWEHCDGTKSVQQILEVISKEFPDEKDIDQRLFLFLQQLKALNYITY